VCVDEREIERDAVTFIKHFCKKAEIPRLQNLIAELTEFALQLILSTLTFIICLRVSQLPKSLYNLLNF